MSAKKTVKKEIRTPVVAVMGHVDHGKTSFLDAIRGSRVAEKEAGGITQNTRAHEVLTKSGFRITFIDTPGHEAFSKMRERGAKVTDYVLLIVAADDGVQPQTKESIEYAKKDNVPLIVAINKIDIKGVNLQKIKSELGSFGVSIEEYGGDVLCFEISAKEKKGLEELLEGIELLSEINELKKREVVEGTIGQAFVLESSLDKRLGNVALCILKSGELTTKSFAVTKKSIFKVRTYLDHNQQNLSTVKESQPFWVSGLHETLVAGETLYFVESEDKAKAFQEKLVGDEVEDFEDVVNTTDAEERFLQMLIKRKEEKEGIAIKKLNVIIKASTEGTLEAVLNKLKEMKSDDAVVSILDYGTGEVTEDEIMRAKLAKGIIVTFQIPVNKKIESLAKAEKVLVRNYEIIYEMFDEVQEVLDTMGEPIEEEVDVAKAKVKRVFVLSDGNVVAGSEVTMGTLLKGYRVKILRNGEEVGKTKISSLRLLKNEVKEVKKGQECGIQLDDKLEVQEGDEVVAFRVERY